MKLAAAAPRYGWTDIVYSLIPNGHHSQYPDDLPAFDGSNTTHAVRHPEAEHQLGPLRDRPVRRDLPARRSIESFLCLFVGRAVRDRSAVPEPDREHPARVHQRPLGLLPEPVVRADRVRPELSRSRSSTPRTFTDPLFPPIENLRMSNRIQSAVPGYPIQQYFGDYEHFVQNKAKEWGDLCGADHHVCTLRRLPGRRRERDARPASIAPASRRG